MKHAEQAYF